MKNSFILIDSNNLLQRAKSPIFLNKQLNQEKTWKEKITEKFPDLTFKNIWLEELMELSPDEVSTILLTPQSKGYYNMVSEKFSAAKILLIEEL
ncbi:MAG: hypothetical protein LBV67_05840 [Streptococcaceae bacterium]|jgi:hypothetical protein|nr:hypothetical protein [Streptococcaceae bacterium]